MIWIIFLIPFINLIIELIIKQFKVCIDLFQIAQLHYLVFSIKLYLSSSLEL